MPEFVFTFGSGQKPHGIGTFVAVNARNYGEARTLMVGKYGDHWAFQYRSRQDAGVDRFHLKCVDVLGEPEHEQPDLQEASNA